VNCWPVALCVTLVLLFSACTHSEADPATESPASAAGATSAPPGEGPATAQERSQDSADTTAPPRVFSEEEVAEAVVRILSARSDKADAGPLVEALALGLPRVELYVLAEFARMGPSVAEHREQVEQLLARPQESVRAAAAKALGKMGNPESVDPLLQVLAGDPSAAVRAASAQALGELRQPTAGKALVEALDDPAPEVRQAAVLAVAQLKWGAAGSALAGRLEVDRDVKVRELVAYALGELGGTQWVSALARALAGDSSPRVRLNAAEALGKVEARGELEVLVAALEDPDVHVREAVVVALGRMGDPGVIGPLEQLLTEATDSALDQLATTTWQTLLKVTSVDRQALWALASGRYRAGDHGRAQEACQRLIERFESTEGAEEVWSAGVLLGVIACERGNGDQAEVLVRRAVATLEQGGVPAERSKEMEELLGVKTSLKEFLMDRLAGALAGGGRGRSALEVWDGLVAEHPERAEYWWGRKYNVLVQMAEAGDWATVDLYLKGAAQAGPDYGGTYHDRLQALAQRATDTLDRMSVVSLVDLWLRALDDVADSLEPRIRAKGEEALTPLVDALERAEIGARRRAVGLLRSLSNQEFDFQPDGDSDARAAAVARWREWLAGRSEAPAVGTPPTTGEPTDSQSTRSNAEE